MGKLYKLRRDIIRNPDKYKSSGKNYWPVRGVSFDRNGKIHTCIWDKGYGGFIKKVLKNNED